MSCGVDYITATYVGPHGESSLASFGRFLVREQEASDEKWREFRFSGYRGETCGSAAFGVRHDSQIVRLSSTVAAEHWAQAFNLCSNVTRFDVQVTVLPGVDVTRRLLDHHKQVRRRARKQGRPPKFKFWYGPSGPEAATYGSRQSDIFGRSYNKGIESGLPEWDGTLRYECELKRERAKATATQLDQSESESSVIIPQVFTFFTKSGCRLETAWSPLNARPSGSSGLTLPHEAAELPNDSPAGEVPDSMLSLGQGRARKRALWLTNAVRPSVQALMASGRPDVVLQTLGLSVENNRLVIDADSVWSNFNKWR